jgi:hypothetical protein
MSYRDHDATQLKNGNLPVLVTTPDSTENYAKDVILRNVAFLLFITSLTHFLFLSVYFCSCLIIL